jgi:uncharacterized membrane protein (Fun14 family)
MSDHGNETTPPVTTSRVPAWAKLLAVASVGLMAVGLALPFVGGGEPAVPPTGAKSAAAPGGAGLTGEASPGPGVAEPAAPERGAAGWGPSVFRVGFSFFVGFAVAYALRSFVKLAVVALGFFFLALFGLQYAGIIEVRWALLAERYNDISGDLQSRAAGLWSSMSAVLPSAASATTGLMAGFWRRGG